MTETKKGYFINRRDMYGQTIRSRGHVGVDSWIKANMTFNLGSSERVLLEELHRLDVEIKSVLACGGAVTYMGEILTIGLNHITDQEFLTDLNDKGVIRCNSRRTGEILGNNLSTAIPIHRHTKVNFYSPQLDNRLSYTQSKGGSLFFHLDDSKFIRREFDPLKHHVYSVISNIALPKQVNISCGTFLTQILADACSK